MAVFCNYTMTAVMVQDFEFDDEHSIKLKVYLRDISKLFDTVYYVNVEKQICSGTAERNHVL